MVDKIISDLESIVSLNGDELLPVENGVGTYSASIDDVKNYALQGGATRTVRGVSYLPKQVTIANNATDSEHDLDFTAGNFDFDDGTGQGEIPALTKRFDATFALGDNNGGMANSQSLPTNLPVYLFQISKDDGTAGEIIGDISRDGSNIDVDSVVIANALTKRKYLGAFITDGDNIAQGKWRYFSSGYIFTPKTPALFLGDYNASPDRTFLEAVNCPVNSMVSIHLVLRDSSRSPSVVPILLVTETSQDDIEPSSAFNTLVIYTNDSAGVAQGVWEGYVDDDREIRFRARACDASVGIFGSFLSFKEYF